jgi:hypothetical protein
MKALAAIVCLCSWFGISCQAFPMSRTVVYSPTSAPLSLSTRAPTPVPGALTDAQTMALVREEVLSRGVMSDSLSIQIAGDPRWASIRYSSSYAIDGRAFRPQMMLIALAAARVVGRAQPPVQGGIRLAVMPEGEGNGGLTVIVIKGSALEAWINGATSDQEFVSQWTEGVLTRE